MQNISKGTIVRSISGHDRNEPYIIYKIEDNYAYLINGKNKAKDSLKKKNIKHIISLGYQKDIIDLMDCNKLDNSDIIRVLKEYR